MNNGNILENLRKEHNFDINTVANLLHITRNNMQELENNTQKLKVSQLLILCDLYQIKAEDILNNNFDEDRNYDNLNQDILTTYYSNRIINNLIYLSSLDL